MRRPRDGITPWQDTNRFVAAAGLRAIRMAVLKKMSRKSIEALPSGHYWAVPHAPFQLDDSNGQAEGFHGRSLRQRRQVGDLLQRRARSVGVQRCLWCRPF
jgi:hypothetical protein